MGIRGVAGRGRVDRRRGGGDPPWTTNGDNNNASVVDPRLVRDREEWRTRLETIDAAAVDDVGFRDGGRGDDKVIASDGVSKEDDVC